MNRKLRFALIALVLAGVTSTVTACAESPTDLGNETGYSNNNLQTGYSNNN